MVKQQQQSRVIESKAQLRTWTRLKARERTRERNRFSGLCLATQSACSVQRVNTSFRLSLAYCYKKLCVRCEPLSVYTKTLYKSVSLLFAIFTCVVIWKVCLFDNSPVFWRKLFLYLGKLVDGCCCGGAILIHSGGKQVLRTETGKSPAAFLYCCCRDGELVASR